MYITRIRAKNFRSLVDTEITLCNYTALVGPNDSGKSNVLRALNLFFNNQTDIGQYIQFEQDYSQNAVRRANRAKEIEIQIEIQPPYNYTDNSPVIWTKTWRAGTSSPFNETIHMIDGMQFSPRSRTEYWVRQLTYEYVPAVRGKEFFATLKRRLHNTLADTIAPRLASASGSFLGNIRKEIGDIEHEAKRIFGLKTEFSLPNDLGNLFEILDLKTADKHAATPLQNRGDGIQGRHIPLILRFLAEQRKINYARGKPPPETIWGYEEPENNLELAKQMEEAQEFLLRSDFIQVLLTTHSPAFYGVAKSSPQAKVWFSQREEGKTNFQESATVQALDEDLGLMPFVEPYLAEAQAKREEMLSELKRIQVHTLHVDRPVLCVEGGTDKEILTAAYDSIFHSAMPFEIVVKPGMGAGVGWATGYATARAAMPDMKQRTAVLFDNDEAGLDARRKLQDHLQAIDRTDRVKIFIVGKNNGDDHIRIIAKAGFKVPIALEELCSTSSWDHAEIKKWLEPRPDLIKYNIELLKTDETFLDVVNKKMADTACRRLINMRIKDFNKGSFAIYAAEEIKKKQTVPPTLEWLVRDLHQYFSN